MMGKCVMCETYTPTGTRPSVSGQREFELLTEAAEIVGAEVAATLKLEDLCRHCLAHLERTVERLHGTDDWADTNEEARCLR